MTTPRVNYNFFMQLYKDYGEKLFKVHNGIYTLKKIEGDELYSCAFLFYAGNGVYWMDPFIDIKLNHKRRRAYCIKWHSDIGNRENNTRNKRTRRELDERLYLFLTLFKIRVGNNKVSI